jgi:hypothetical protein
MKKKLIKKGNLTVYMNKDVWVFKKSVIIFVFGCVLKVYFI